MGCQNSFSHYIFDLIFLIPQVETCSHGAFHRPSTCHKRFLGQSKFPSKSLLAWSSVKSSIHSGVHVESSMSPSHMDRWGYALVWQWHSIRHGTPINNSSMESCCVVEKGTHLDRCLWLTQHRLINSWWQVRFYVIGNTRYTTQTFILIVSFRYP